MIRHLRLKYSIMLVNVIPLLLIIFVAIAVHINVQTVETTAQDADLAHAVTVDIKDFYTAIIEMQRASRGYLLSKNEVSLANYQKSLEQYQTLLQQLPPKIKDPTQRENFRKISETCGNAAEQVKQLFAWVNEGKPDQAQEIFKTHVAFDTDRDVAGLLDLFETRENEITAERTTRQNDAIAFLGRVLFGGVFLAIVIALFLGQWLASKIAEWVAGAINNASSTSTEIAATIEQHERTANHQAAMVTETTTTMEELGTSSRQTAEQASAGTEITKRVVAQMDEGKDCVKQAVQAMNNLKAKVEGIAQETLNLGDQTGQVGNIAELVKEFAGQINMLSLNAAVEAARAGEHGKGFAVVAAEIRKLSGESKKAAEQTKAIVVGIKKATDSTLMKTEEGTRNIELVATLAGKIGGMFDQLTDTMGQLNDSSQQVLLNARQQTLAVGQVIEAVKSINAGAKETAAGLTQTKIGIRNLNDMTDRLKEMI